jgi:hypothetical protein
MVLLCLLERFIVITMLFFYVEVQTQRWNGTMLQSNPPVPDKGSVDLLVERKIVEKLDWGCLFGTEKHGHSKNKWHEIDYNKSEALKDPDFFRGTTFWINEYMAVGHMMYDVALLQVLQTTKIDRIIIQRAACTGTQCAGVGTFDGFFKGLYISMIDSYHSEVPIFVRWTWKSKDMKPMYIGSLNPKGELDIPIERRHLSFSLKSITCMERVIRNPMRCLHCFRNSISPTAAARFKEVAYSMIVSSDISSTTKELWRRNGVHIDMKATADIVDETAFNASYAHGRDSTDPLPPKVVPKLPSFFPRGGPIVVTLAHRGVSASRHLDNIPLLVKVLQQHLTEPMFEFRVVDTTDSNRGFQEQIRFVAESQVIIAEHGAFQSHVVYLRNGSLLVDLVGDYKNGEIPNFQNLAQMFGVFYASVVTLNLTDHKSAMFNISESECQEVVRVVQQYASEKPFTFNIR